MKNNNKCFPVFTRTLTCYLAAKERRISAVLKDKNLATNYSVQEVKEKWFDIRLERNIMACGQYKTTGGGGDRTLNNNSRVH